jgi:hypothetical protein
MAVAVIQAMLPTESLRVTAPNFLRTNNVKVKKSQEKSEAFPAFY